MDKIWLSHYQTGVPETIESCSNQTIVDLFISSCEKNSNKPAFRHFDERMSYQRVKQQAIKFAAFLQSLGLKKGARIAIMLPNMMQYPIALFGSHLAGLIVINTNPLYTANELSHQLKDGGAEAILILENFAPSLAAALPELPQLKHIIVTEIGDALSWPKRTIINFVVRYIKKMIPKHQLAYTHRWADTQNHAHRFEAVSLGAEDLAFIQYTGGTTGIAKGAMLSHGNMMANVKQCTAWIKPGGFGANERIVTALPLYHVFSLTANLMTFFNLGAENLLITNPKDLSSFIKDMKHFKFTAITGVNTLFNVLLHHSDFKKIDFSALKLTLSGGMALQETVANLWQETTHKPILEAYGLTETSPGICISPLYIKEYNHSVGLPLPSTDISIRDEHDNELGINQAGELCVQGPQVMQGYWQRPRETEEAFTPDHYFKTGDIAKIDEHGFVYIVDRKKDMILVSGFNVYPNEVEQVIGMLPAVLEVGVIGVKQDDGIERVKACIVKTDPNLSAEDIRQHCKHYLTSYKIPKIIEFYDSLPKTNVGKILRRQLR